MIAIVDYDAGNIASVKKALEYIGQTPVITRDVKEISKADKLIVPGVGAYQEAVARMDSYGLTAPIREYAASGRPIFGICLGLQLFFERSEESVDDVEGLSLLPGRILRFPATEGFKIPHMGWNSINIKNSSGIFKDIPNGSFVYFVHSYYLQAENEEDVAAECEYIVPFHAAVAHKNIFATQFHPEKSGEVGLQILKNYVEL